MHDAASVKQRILSNLEPYLYWIFPNGKVKGHQFEVGSIQGEEGSSLKIELRGERAGVFCDFASQDVKGDCLDLYCQAKNVPFAQAFKEICAYLGITNLERPKPVVKPPPPDLSEVGLMKNTPVYQYMVQQRGINDATMRTYRVKSFHRKTELNEWHVCFPYIDPEGQLCMIKTLGLNRAADGKKEIWSSKPYYTLFGWHTVKPSDRQCIITSGELDAMTVHQLEPGMPVLSVPAGDNNHTWIEIDYDALLRFERIYLCFDDDPSGEKGAQEAAKRLGLTRCFRMKAPTYKDANQCLLESARTGDPDLIEVSKWLERAFSYDPPTLRPAKSYLDAGKRRLLRWQEEEKGPTFVLPAVPFNIRDGECTLLVGISSHGKSESVYQIFVHEMRNGRKCCICSMEIDPDEMLLNMATQLCGHEPSVAEWERALDWFDGRLWFFHPKEDVIKTNWQPLFDDFSYAARRFGCTRFAIDSLLFCVKKDDYEAQDLFCTTIRNFDRTNDTHTFLIAHASPKKSEKDVPSLSDIQGSSGIIAPFSNIFIIWRNTEKEEKLEKAEEDSDTAEVEKLKKSHDGIWFIAKQRHTGKRSKTKVWFDRTSRTFRTQADLPPPKEGNELF